MLGVLLTILKIFGIILLVILGILLLLILIILFVPIRYKLYAKKPESNNDFTVKLNVSFLLHIFSFWANYNRELDIKVKILGINISSILKKRRGKKVKDNFTETEEINNTVSSSICTENENSNNIEEIEYSIDWNEEPEDIKETVSSTNDEIHNNNEDTLGDDIEDMPTSFKERIKQFGAKITKLPDMIFDFFDHLEDKMDDIGVKLENVSKRISYYDRLVNDYRNRQAFDVTIRECRLILRKIFPKKCWGSVRIGFEDPATLGSVLMYIGIFSPILPSKLEYIPVYDEEVFDGCVNIKGGFTIFDFVMAAFRLYFNKNVRRLYKIIKRKK